MRKVWVVAWREFRATVFTWAFLLSVLGVPAIGMAVSIALPLMMAASGAFDEAPLEGTTSLVGDADRVSALRLEAAADDDLGGIHLVDATSVDAELDRLRAGDIVGVVQAGERPTLWMTEALDDHQRTLSDWVAAAEARHLASAAGLDVDRARALLKEREPQVTVIGDEVEEDSDERTMREATGFLVAFLGETLLWLGVFVSAQFLLQTTMEERSNKVIEVLLSAVSPLEMMTGKLIGLGLVGTLMTGAYGSVMLVALVTLGAATVTPLDFVLFGVFYAIAYLQMGPMFAAIGSTVSEPREAQSLMTPAVLLMVLPFLCLPMLIENPVGGWAVGLSLVPPLTPYVMIFRLLGVDTPVPWWQLALGIVLSGTWAAFMVWASARVFRIGVLMQGKTPTPLEVLRWLRES